MYPYIAAMFLSLIFGEHFHRATEGTIVRDQLNFATPSSIESSV
jgi:hypothetical protein